jgi:ribosomal protein L12E/L44/L45/RPP1/RPP2
VKELTKIGDELSRFPAETEFSKLAGSFELKQGEAGSSDMVLEMSDQNMHMALLLEGALGLNTTLDFLGKLRFAPESRYYDDVERTFRDFKQADGSIELPFPIPIGGTLLKPEISRKSIQQSLTAFGAELAKNAVKNEVEKQAIQLLQEVLSDSPSEPTPTPAPSQESDQKTSPPAPTPTPKPEEVLEEVGKDLLRGLFK